VIANLLDGQRVLVLSDRHDPVADREIGAGEDGVHTGQRGGTTDVDAQDLRVAVRAAEQPADEHPRQVDVVGVHGLARGLGVGVDFGVAAADSGGALILPGFGRDRHHAPPRIRAAASSTASMIA
jgi:hypothetical protein